MMMKGSGRESGDGEIGRTPEQPARPRGSGAGLSGGGFFFMQFVLAGPHTCVAPWAGVRMSGPDTQEPRSLHHAGGKLTGVPEGSCRSKVRLVGAHRPPCVRAGLP